MKRYRLIEEYPGSPKMPIEVFKNGNYYQSNFSTENVQHFHKPLDIVEKNPKFWKEIEEKDYEVLEYRCNRFDLNIIGKLKEDGLYHFEGANYSPISEVTNINYKIHSIKRTSDGEVFTVGEVANFGENENHKIKSFSYLSNNNFWAFYNTKKEYGSNISFLKKLKKPLFKTEDGVNIFDGDSYFLVTKDFKKGFCSFYSESDLEFKLFSDGEKADEYIKMNEPKFSRNQIIKMLDKLK